MVSSLPPGERLPPRRLPWLYLMAGQAALAAALVLTALQPAIFGEFFYHPRALAVVHLVTIGWITGSILGALYILSPVAWRAPVRAGRLDAIAFLLWLVGLVGMFSHFWIDSYGGMVWSAATVLVAVGMVGARILPGVVRAPVPIAHRLHLPLAFLNLAAAATLGAWIGLEKLGVAIVPGAPLPSVYAHAHLAAVGWATLTVVGAGQRLLPMFLPSAMPPPAFAVGSLVAIEAGLIALVVGFMRGGSERIAGAWLIGIGILLFLAQVVWMLAHRRRPPASLPRPDLALGHTLQALLWLAVSTGIGLWLAHQPTSATSLRLAAVYGALGLVGFLTQLVVGIGGRLLPMTVWMQGFVDSGFVPPSRSQHRLTDRRLQAATLLLWSVGIPLLCAGLYGSYEPAIRVAATLLAIAVILDGCNRLLVLRSTRALRRATST